MSDFKPKLADEISFLSDSDISFTQNEWSAILAAKLWEIEPCSIQSKKHLMIRNDQLGSVNRA